MTETETRRLVELLVAAAPPTCTGTGRSWPRAGSASCGGCSAPSARRSSGSSASGSGPVRLDDLPSGRARRLRAPEIRGLGAGAGTSRAGREARSRARRAGGSRRHPRSALSRADRAPDRRGRQSPSAILPRDDTDPGTDARPRRRLVVALDGPGLVRQEQRRRGGRAARSATASATPGCSTGPSPGWRSPAASPSDDPARPASPRAARSSSPRTTPAACPASSSTASTTPTTSAGPAVDARASRRSRPCPSSARPCSTGSGPSPRRAASSWPAATSAPSSCPTRTSSCTSTRPSRSAPGGGPRSAASTRLGPRRARSSRPCAGATSSTRPGPWRRSAPPPDARIIATDGNRVRGHGRRGGRRDPRRRGAAAADDRPSGQARHGARPAVTRPRADRQLDHPAHLGRRARRARLRPGDEPDLDRGCDRRDPARRAR